MADTLVIYYSRKGENYAGGAVRSLAKGNTEIVAEYIAGITGADLFEVETVKTYSADYTKCTEEAKAELQADARPELKAYLDNLDAYENIVVAGPCWWGTYPMAVFTLLDRLDFDCKTVLPVMTHEGSGLAEAAKALKKHCHGAMVGPGLAIRGSEVEQAKPQIERWARQNRL